jgi:hypothetical protein
MNGCSDFGKIAKHAATYPTATIAQPCMSQRFRHSLTTKLAVLPAAREGNGVVILVTLTLTPAPGDGWLNLVVPAA